MLVLGVTRMDLVPNRLGPSAQRQKSAAMEAKGCRGGFIECPHTLPLRDLKPGMRTRLADLSLLCAKCHRMVHVRSPWLSVADVRDLLAD